MQKKKKKKKRGLARVYRIHQVSDHHGQKYYKILFFFLRWELELILEFDPVIFIIEGSDFQLKCILYPLNTPGNLTACEDMLDCHNLMGSTTGVSKLLTIS